MAFVGWVVGGWLVDAGAICSSVLRTRGIRCESARSPLLKPYIYSSMRVGESYAPFPDCTYAGHSADIYNALLACVRQYAHAHMYVFRCYGNGASWTVAEIAYDSELNCERHKYSNCIFPLRAHTLARRNNISA